MTVTYFLVAAHDSAAAAGAAGRRTSSCTLFAILFGFGMGADYMLIPLMAADQFGVNTLARAMAIILPANTIGQTWFPYLVSRAAAVIRRATAMPMTRRVSRWR